MDSGNQHAGVPPDARASRKSLFVISDLHLGGADGFQICTARGRRRLAAFLRSIPELTPQGSQPHLILAGDIVDFLAEAPFAAFTTDDGQATGKLARIMDHGDTADIWSALHALVARGHPFTLMLGNHDLELSLPGPRRLLHERLGSRGVEFLYDNQVWQFREATLARDEATRAREKAEQLSLALLDTNGKLAAWLGPVEGAGAQALEAGLRTLTTARQLQVTEPPGLYLGITGGTSDLRRSAPITTLAGHGAWVWSAAFSPNGTRVVTASADGTARLWIASPEGWLIEACNLPQFHPTSEEVRELCRPYLGRTP